MLPSKLKAGMRWISGRGALVVVPRIETAHWGGLHAPELRQDFTTAIQALDESGLRLLLSDGFDTTWWPLPTLAGGMLVRWLWADDPHDVVAAVQSVTESEWVEEEFTLLARDGCLSLFEATDGTQPQEEMAIFVVPGEYRISTANVQPDEDTCLLIHRFLLVH